MVLREIKAHKPYFEPVGLTEWMSRQADGKRDEAKQRLDNIEQRVRNYVISVFQEQFGEQTEDWWLEVPEQVRTTVARQREQDKRSRGDEGNYLTYADIRKTSLEHWRDLFQAKLGYGTRGNKDQRTQWLIELSTLQKRLNKEGSAALQSDEYHHLIEVDAWLEEKGI